VTQGNWKSGEEGEWTVELACGHRIGVPAVPGALATIACVREHRRLHHQEVSRESPPDFLIPSLAAAGEL